MTDQRYLCIHGHFYQPPRENPWLETVEPQDSAFPYHDWNERITAECYEPNTAARILEGNAHIARLVNNYARMSFNFGPTLMKWLEDREPEVYRDIIDADARSIDRFEGHGSAIAQAYNHQILPLANPRDRQTQIRWGLRDFEHRFGRPSEGMWLPETAANLATLQDLADAGVAYTILAPHQAKRSRKIGETAWVDHRELGIDPTRPYRVSLPGGKSIAVFFYDGPISRAVAFEGLLRRGELFAERLLTAFHTGPGPQLAHIATDGETYGHHHRHGEMALAYALDYIEKNKLAKLTNYGLHLEMFPPEYEAEIVDDTSWSCAHGIERWRSDCGCNSGRAGWNQAWRAPLLQALHWLRDATEGPFEREAARHFTEPWEARDGYIDVVLDRSEEALARFFERYGTGDHDIVTSLKLMELQRHAMLMYTSCGWFFDDISGIETVQVIQYAGRVVQLARETLGLDLEAEFVERLAAAKSNLPEQGDGASVYRRYVEPAIVDLPGVAAHFAMNALFSEYETEVEARSDIYPYLSEMLDIYTDEAGPMRLFIGRSKLTAIVTRESAEVTFAVLHFGDHNVSAGVREYLGPDAYAEMTRDLSEAFARADYPEIVRLQERYFNGAIYSLRSIFRDEQRHILSHIIEQTMQSVAASYRDIYEQNYPLMSSLRQFDFPLPAGLRVAAETVLHEDVLRELRKPIPDFGRVEEIVFESRTWNLKLDQSEELRFAYELALERMARAMEREPEDLALLENLGKAAGLTRRLDHDIDRWQVQKAYYAIAHSPVYALAEANAGDGDEEASEWLERFRALGDWLQVIVPLNGD